jgi:[protein-PII] uridylyltransferase
VLEDLRIRLHYLAGRREDRLVFDHQIEIARQLKLPNTKALAASDC